MTCLCCQLFIWGNDVCFYSSIGSLKAHTRRERTAVAVLARPLLHIPKHGATCVLCDSWQSSHSRDRSPSADPSLHSRSLHLLEAYTESVLHFERLEESESERGRETGGIFLGDGICWGLSWWFRLPRDMVLLPTRWYGTDRCLRYFFYQDCQTSLSWTRAVVQRSVLKKKSHVLFKRTLGFSKRPSLETFYDRF